MRRPVVCALIAFFSMLFIYAYAQAERSPIRPKLIENPIWIPEGEGGDPDDLGRMAPSGAESVAKSVVADTGPRSASAMVEDLLEWVSRWLVRKL